MRRHYSVAPGRVLDAGRRRASACAASGGVYSARAQLADTIALVASGKLRPIVTERFSFDEAPRVHRLMVEKKLRGRVLLVP